MVGTMVMRMIMMTTTAPLVTAETEDSRMEVVVMAVDMEGEDMEAVDMAAVMVEVVTGAAATM